MRCEIRYISRTGNTKKLALAIGQAVKAPVKTVEVPLEGPLDLLFLGGSVYAADIDDSLKKFIANLKPGQVKKAAVFSTAAVLSSAYPKIEKRLEAAGVKVSEKEFHCPGSFLFLHRGRPNRQDLQNAAAFAKNVVLLESKGLRE